MFNLASLLASVLAGCGGNTSDLAGQNNQATGQPVMLTIETNSGTNEPNIMSESGQRLSVEELKTTLAATKDNSQPIQLKMAGDEPSTVPDGAAQTRGISVWKYWADIRWEWGYVPGCIHANAWHLNLHLRDTSANRELVNIHLASWWQNGPQFGIYNSGVNKFCAQSRGTFMGIREALTDFFRYSAKMPSWAALQWPIPWPSSVSAACRSSSLHKHRRISEWGAGHRDWLPELF